MHIWRLPDYWYWIVPLLFLVAMMFCAVKWRQYLLGFIAIFSLVIFFLVAIAWIVSWNTRYYVSLTWIKNQPSASYDERVQVWNFHWITQHGGLRLALSGSASSEQHSNAKEFGPRSLIWSTSDTQGRYPIFNNRLSITKSDFVQKTLGFQICWATNDSPPSSIGLYSITVPHWFAMLLCLPIPAVWLKRFLRKRSRIKRGICVKCAYDLRASTDKCPECGTPIPPRKEIAKAPDAAKPAS